MARTWPSVQLIVCKNGDTSPFGAATSGDAGYVFFLYLSSYQAFYQHEAADKYFV